MKYSVLIASNDVVTRELLAKFLESNDFTCTCVPCDEKLFPAVRRVKPHALLTETFLQSPWFSQFDSDTAFAMILAARCCIPWLPVIILNKFNSPDIRATASRLRLTGFFSYPLDLMALLGLLRTELRRISRLKNPSEAWSGVPDISGIPRRRGRPRKYLLPAQQPRTAAGVAA